MRTLHAGLFPVASSKIGKCLDCGAEGAAATAGAVDGFLVCVGAWPADETLALASVAATPRVSRKIRRSNVPRMRIPREGGRHKSGLGTKVGWGRHDFAKLPNVEKRRRPTQAPPVGTERKLVRGWRMIVAVAIVVAIPLAVTVGPIVTIAGTAVVAVPAPAVVVVPVARPLAPFAVAAVNDFKVGAAPTIYPDAFAIITPSAVEDAIGLAALADDEDAVARVHRAKIAVHVIGRAVDQGSRFRLPVAGNAEVGAAAAIRPDSALAIAPRLAFDARGLATLANQVHPKAGICGAPDAFHGVGGAIDHVGVTPAVELVIAAAEFAFVVLIAIRVMISAVVARCVLVASAVDTNKEKLLIVT